MKNQSLEDKIQMVLRIPDYYRQFRCLMGDCRDSCCKGWEIDIDEETYDYYMTVKGRFGDRIREAMSAEEGYGFALKDGHCPFLNGQGLCDICTELGEEALSEVCTEYPRFVVEYGEVKEKSLAISCEEAGRLILGRKEKIRFEEIRENGCLECEKENLFFPMEIEKIREKAIQILQDRTGKVEKRAAKYLKFCEKMQTLMEQEKKEAGTFRQGLDRILAETQPVQKTKPLYTLQQSREFLQARVKSLQGLELLEEKWEEKITELQKLAELPEYTEETDAFQKAFADREYAYENLLVYFTGRYFMKAVYDTDILNRAKFAVFGYLTIRDLDLISWKKKKSGYGQEADRLKELIVLAQVYSREVEHAEENVEYLMGELAENPAFTIENMIQQCSAGIIF